MHNSQAKDLFQLQTELIDMKVDMVVSKTIDRVVEQINGLKYQIHTEIHGLREEMNERFSSLDNRVVAVETKLGMVNDKQDKISTAVIQYVFKAGWAAMGLCVLLTCSISSVPFTNKFIFLTHWGAFSPLERVSPVFYKRKPL